MTPEGRVKHQIYAHLRTMLHAYVFLPVQHGYGKRTLDCMCCVEGRFVAIEVKRPGETPTALQRHVINEIKDAGGIAFWADSFESYQAQITAALKDVD